MSLLKRPARKNVSCDNSSLAIIAGLVFPFSYYTRVTSRYQVIKPV